MENSFLEISRAFEYEERDWLGLQGLVGVIDVIERYGYIVAMIVSTTISTRENILLIAAFGGSQNPDWEKWKDKIGKNAEDMEFNARLLDKLFDFRHSAASATKCCEVLKQLFSEGPNDVLLFEAQSQIRTLEKSFHLDIENEKYFRVHPELGATVQLFIYKVLDDRPDNILAYAGQFFDRAELHEVVKKSIDANKEAEGRIQYLNDLIKGKTLIE
ncbi:MAG: hypothetical protein MIO92_15570 [Methanosarcinaceae archaeon]|nr:hypothetical protein [Methanosarcinaceae archaeon]